MKFALLGVVSALGSNGVMLEEDYKFMEFVSFHGRSYATKAEFNFRMNIFKNNLKFVQEFNADENNTHTVEINHFSDRTPQEMKKMLGYKPALKERLPTLLPVTDVMSIDWRTKGAVTPVKNQGQCGSCWAFSTTGAVEGAMFLKTGKLQSYSEQQLVDCSSAFGNYGCNGGLMDNAFQYVEKNPLELETDYAYTGRDGTCKYVAAKGQGKVVSYSDVTPNSADQLKAALAKQPVSVAIEADQMSFQGYKSGVITTGCGQNLDHGVLAVGYGTLNNQEFFLVKNSWGTGWGDQGYVRISTSASNVCGILSDPSYPTE
jgi:cathepsin L